MKVGSASAFRGLAVFLVVFAALLALKRAGMPDMTGLVWWVIVLGASVYLAWKGLTTRNRAWIPRTRRMECRHATKTIALDAWRGRGEAALRALGAS